MELLTDVAFLSRVQFALVVFVHFVFVPLSIGIGLIMAINETRYYRSRNPKDEAATRFWVKIFTTTFAVEKLHHMIDVPQRRRTGFLGSLPPLNHPVALAAVPELPVSASDNIRQVNGVH